MRSPYQLDLLISLKSSQCLQSGQAPVEHPSRYPRGCVRSKVLQGASKQAILFINRAIATDRMIESWRLFSNVGSYGSAEFLLLFISYPR
jgi:hypothetical protein